MLNRPTQWPRPVSQGPRAGHFITDYDLHSGEWWDPRGRLAALSWIARARAELVPRAARSGAILLDVACGGGLFHPHIQEKGYRHLGVDLSVTALADARDHGVDVVLRGDIGALPIADESVDVVAAGQCLEHVLDLAAVIAECCRVLRPGGTLVLDTIADTFLARLLVITLCERLPLRGMPPRGCHDHRLFVNREKLCRLVSEHGVDLRLRGLLPRLDQGMHWLLGNRPDVRFVPIGNTSVFFQAAGLKRLDAG
jgi:2-polyprenyl-6-hydroxyphenyl methylase/3-demethylubiquinone-9 3-methyltransferase